MFTKDNSQSEIDSLVREVKASVTLDAESQQPEYSGNEAGDVAEAGPKSAVGPQSKF